MGEFDVVTAALCDSHVLHNFVEHYDRQGASNIYIYFDSEELPAGLVVSTSKCVITLCDTDFWMKLGMERPSSLEERQRQIYNNAYRTCSSAWCLVVDIDEYVFGKNKFAHYLNSFDEKTESIRLMCAESCFTDEDNDAFFQNDVFRTAIPKYLSPIISTILYGSDGKIFSRGLLGHSRGKQAIRCGIYGISIGIHDAKVDGRDLVEFNASQSENCWIAHFDAINFEYWCDKFQGRLDRRDVAEAGKKRDIQLDKFAQQNSERDKRIMFRRLYYLPAWKVRLLNMLGYIKFAGPFSYPSKTEINPI